MPRETDSHLSASFPFIGWNYGALWVLEMFMDGVHRLWKAMVQCFVLN